MRFKFTCLLLLFSFWSLAQSNCSSNRYQLRVFNNITVQRDVQYGAAIDYTGANRNLKFDIFLPANDSLTYRPVIIWAHAGAFIDLINDKGTNDMQAFADSFAHKGYVTLSIDYRTGYLGVQPQVERAVYRAGQDGKAVVRYLKAHYQDYGIDTNNIFFAGSSAGSVVGLALAYIDKESERPASSYGGGGLGADLGCLDCATNALTNTSNIKALVSMWGGLDDTSYLENPTDIPTLLIHGTDDQIVPYDKGKPFANAGLWFPDMYGSLPLHLRMTNVGIKHEFYPFDLPPATINHEFYGTTNGYWINGGPNQYWDTIHTLITNFLYKQLEPVIDTVYGNRNICIGSEQLYVLPHTDGSRYCIDISNGHVTGASGDSITITWDSTGSGEISIKELSELDAEGDTYSLSVTVNPLPLLVPPSDRVVCAGETTTLQASGTGNISWSPSAGLSNNTGTSTTANPSTTTTYSIVLTDANGCISNDSLQVVVNPLPVIDISLSVTGLQVQVDDTNSTIASWLWDFGDGDTSTDESPVHTYGQSGNYTITLNVTDSNGCSSTNVKSLYASGPSGISDTIEESLTIIPQYQARSLYISSLSIAAAEITVSDISGRVLKRLGGCVLPQSLDLSYLTPGIYIITIHTDSHFIHRKFLWE